MAWQAGAEGVRGRGSSVLGDEVRAGWVLMAMIRISIRIRIRVSIRVRIRVRVGSGTWSG